MKIFWGINFYKYVIKVLCFKYSFVVKFDGSELLVICIKIVFVVLFCLV